MAGLERDLTGAFFDTSVLLGGIIELQGPNAPAQRAMQAVADGVIERPRTAWHCCLEFYSVATRLPPEFRVAPELAQQLVDREIMARFVVHSLPRDRRESFLRGASADGLAGGRIYDGHIAEIARTAGADIVITDNRKHFSSLMRHGITVWTSAELAHAL